MIVCAKYGSPETIDLWNIITKPNKLSVIGMITFKSKIVKKDGK